MLQAIEGEGPTFLLHAKRLGQQYGVDPLEILVELGRRKTVASRKTGFST